MFSVGFRRVYSATLSDAAERTTPGPSNAKLLWLWVTTLYFAESLPNAVVGEVSKLFYTDMGMDAIELALVTGSMYLAWVVKPLWSPFVDLFKTKRWWIVTTQVLLALAFAGLGFSMHLENWKFWTAAFFWSLAFISATHDIAADGFYILGMDERSQAYFNGVRGTAYKLGVLAAKGGLVALAGRVAINSGDKVHGWTLAMALPAAFYLCCALYHFLVLPRPVADRRPAPPAVKEEVTPLEVQTGFWSGYLRTFTSFFAKPRIGAAIAFMLLFRFAEAQILAMVSPFLKDPIAKGGLALTVEQVGIVYGTFGAVGAMVGGITGGLLVARHGLKKTYWPMIVIMHAPNVVFLGLALWQPTNLNLISAALFVEQFGYGFGFTLYTLYLIYFSRGPLSTSHFAVCTGFMAMSMMLPSMISGYIKTALGFQGFFGYALLATLPSFYVSYLAWKDNDFVAYFQPKSSDAATSA